MCSSDLLQGQKIALVGERDSGKTTLVKLLLNLFGLKEEEILINGNNIKDINLESLREKIAYISQETFLFRGSIMDNLTLELDDVTIEDVIETSSGICGSWMCCRSLWSCSSLACFYFKFIEKTRVIMLIFEFVLDRV